MALSDAKIRAAKPQSTPIKLIDGFGLYLEVLPSGRRSWRFRYWLDGVESRMTLGQYPLMSLQDARKARDRLRELIDKGISPSQERKREKLTRQIERENTLRVVADEWLALKQSTWSPHTYISAYRCITQNAYPAFGDMPIRDIQPPMILSVLRRMETRGAPKYAIRLRTFLSQIFRYGISTLRCDTNPAELLEGAVVSGVTRHSRAIPIVELRELWARLEGYGGHRVTVLAIKLLALTFVRTHEIRGAEWTDIQGDLWAIPPEKMKIKGFGRRDHLVPLSRQAQAVVEELRAITGGGRLLFPSAFNPSQSIGENTINVAIVSMGFAKSQITGHAFRATASTWLYDQGYYGDMIELQLAHVDRNKTRRAYRHSEWLEERRAMMQAYADWLIPSRDHA